MLHAVVADTRFRQYCQSVCYRCGYCGMAKRYKHQTVQIEIQISKVQNSDQDMISSEVLHT